MKRIFLFLATNLAVLVLLSSGVFIIERVFGVHLAGSGLGGLLVFAAICGFGGALIPGRGHYNTIHRKADDSRK